MKKYQIIAGILAVLCMIMIFGFSAQPSEDSGEVSGMVSEQLLSTANKWLRLNLDYEKILEIAEKIEPAVRKTAHAAEYGMLAVLIFLFLDCKSWASFKQAVLTVGAAALYAATDEIHQRFVPGRYGCITDVMIDGAGAAAAVLCVIGVRACINFLSKKNKSAEKRSSSGEKT